MSTAYTRGGAQHYLNEGSFQILYGNVSKPLSGRDRGSGNDSEPCTYGEAVHTLTLMVCMACRRWKVAVC